MPSFPTSVFAPASKSAGSVIQPAHVNDLQDEVVAIEAGYINGTAPLNSSNLNVTGTSTFANRPIMPPPDCVRLGIDDPFQFAITSTASPSWTRNELITNSSMHSTTTNPTLVIPQSTGVYLCLATIYFRSATGHSQFVSIEDSSGGFVAHVESDSTPNIKSVHAAGLKRIDTLSGSTQWFRVVVYSNGSTNSLSTLVGYTQFEVIKL